MVATLRFWRGARLAQFVEGIHDLAHKKNSPRAQPQGVGAGCFHARSPFPTVSNDGKAAAPHLVYHCLECVTGAVTGLSLEGAAPIRPKLTRGLTAPTRDLDLALHLSSFIDSGV